MIVLDVEKYCHECPEFEADVDSGVVRDCYGKLFTVDHTIRCRHREKCIQIRNYIEKENKK